MTEKNNIDKVVSAIKDSADKALEADIRRRLTDLVYIVNEPGDKFFIGTVEFKYVEIILHGSIYSALRNIFKYLKDFLENPTSHNDIDSRYKRDHILLIYTAVQDMMKELNMKL